MVRYAQHTLDIEATVDLSHVCPSCGHGSQATVRAVGQGTTYGGSRAGPTAGQRAQLEAEARSDILPDARESLGLVPCPKCGRRNPRVLLWVALRALIFSAVCGVAIGAFALVPIDMLGLLGPGRHHPASAFATAAAWVAVPAVLVIEALLVASRVRRAREAVRFASPS